MTITDYFTKYPTIFANHQDWLEKLIWLDTYIQPNYYSDGAPYDKSTTGMFIEWRSVDKKTWIYNIHGLPVTLSVRFADEKHKVFYLLRWY